MVDIYNQFKDFKAFEVVFIDKEKQLQTLYCTIKSIENNRIFLDANNQKNHNTFADVGDELRLHIYTENGIYSATSKILLVSKGVLSTEYIIAYPANSKHSQRREYFRADMSVGFRMDVVTSAENSEKIVIEAKTKNVCGKGMNYISDSPFPEHETIGLDLFFKEREVHTQATVVYSKQIVAGNNPKYVHAFAFTSISQDNINFVVKKCFLHQLDVRKQQQRQHR